MNISVPNAPWCLHKLWTHGHVGVVRSLLWDEEVGSVPSQLLLSDTRFTFQNHTLVTGGEDGKINSWPIHPVELEMEELIDEDDANGDEMDVDMSSPIGRKRERAGDNETVRFFFFYKVYFLVDIICVIARETSQTLTGQAVSQVAHSAGG